MRLLHTSDWHLGRTLHGVDLLGHQSAFHDHRVEVVRAERVDAVLVAGDVYDRAIPPVEAVALLSDALARLADLTTVVITPGNHDSAARLGFGSALMRERIRIVATPADLDRPVVLDGPDERVLVYGLPYLDPDVARHTLAVGDAPLPRSHAAVLGAAMDRVRADLAVRRAGAGQTPVRAVVLAHAFVVGGAASESERDIRVGGVDHAPTSTFDGVDYVALGHLHGPQRVGAAEGGTVLRYAGSPLAYSFSEAGHTKSVALVDLGPDGPAEVRLLPTPVPRRLTDLTGTLDDLLGVAGDAHTEDWVRVTVTDVQRPADLYRRVRERFGHALVVQHQPPVRTDERRAAVVTAARDPLEVVEEFVTHVRGTAATPAESAVLRRAYEQVVAAERSA
jgi:exonuclease SbcD